MSIDVINDDLIQLSEAARLYLPNPTNPATLWRWHKRGVLVGDRRIRLETVRVGRIRYTTETAFRRFVARTNEAEQPAGPAADPDRHDRTDAKLRAAGVLS